MGALLVLAFAPFELYLLAPVCVAGLFWLATPLVPKEAFARGFAFGFAEFVAGTYWLYISIHEMGKAPLWMAIPLMGGLVLIMAVFIATSVWAAIGLAQPGWIRNLLIMPAVWALMEWVRDWFMTGFPWLSLGYSQVPSVLGGYAPLLGVFGVSWLVALTGGALLQGISSRRGLLAAGLIIAIIWINGYLLRQVRWTHPTGRPIKVSLVQGNIAQDRKWLPSELGPTLSRYRKLTEQHWDSQLIIWPEAAVPGFYDELADSYLTDLQDEAIKHGSDIMLGILVYKARRHEYFNAVLSLGGSRHFYYKRHLVPFGEFFPVPGWVRSWLRLMNLPSEDFTSGAANQKPLPVAGEKAGVSICYEDAFGEEVISMLPAATFLVNVSNDAWFGGSIAPEQHLQMARMRALESGRFLVRATNTGITAIIDPEGTVSERLPQFQMGVLSAQIQPLAGATVYARFGNWLSVGFLLSVMLGCLALPKSRRTAVSVSS
ncbi:MAG: apolipoprotein N-acyltransferase [Rhodothermales bacterium]